LIQFEEIKHKLEDIVKDSPNKKERLDHSIRVMEMALSLNKHYNYGLDEEKIKIGCIVHDYGKLIDPSELKDVVKNHPLSRNDSVLHSKEIHHALFIPKFLTRDFGITDPEILDAAMFHCTGKDQMSLLTKLVFISDYVEVGRDFANCAEVREIAFKDFERSIYEALRRTIECISGCGRVICDYTLKALDEYKNKLEK